MTTVIRMLVLLCHSALLNREQRPEATGKCYMSLEVSLQYPSSKHRSKMDAENLLMRDFRTHEEVSRCATDSSWTNIRQCRRVRDSELSKTKFE
jgi:hypothetical protein